MPSKGARAKRQSVSKSVSQRAWDGAQVLDMLSFAYLGHDWFEELFIAFVVYAVLERYVQRVVLALLVPRVLDAPGARKVVPYYRRRGGGGAGGQASKESKESKERKGDKREGGKEKE